MSEYEKYRLIAEILKWALIFLSALAAALIVSSPVLMYVQKRRARKMGIEQAFAGREPLHERVFHEKYFRSSRVPAYVVISIRRILENQLRVNLSRLADEDDFTGNLSFLWDYDDYESIGILEDIEAEFSISISDEEASRMKTVRDIVDVTWAKIQQRHTGN